MNTKLYLYGVILSDEDGAFGPVGLSTDGTPSEILFKSHKGFGIIYSLKEIEDDEEIPPTRKNLINHQKVIEVVMEEHTILPFSFGTVSDSIDLVIELIEERFEEFSASIAKIDGKVELSLKVMWEKMDVVFARLVEENEAIKQKKDYLATHNIQDQNEKMELGKMVEQALLDMKDKMLQVILGKLLPLAIDHKVQKNITESMFANIAFFVKKEDETVFDQAVNDLSEELTENTAFKYVGPMAPFNFI